MEDTASSLERLDNLFRKRSANVNVNISLRHKYVYVALPKVASSSIKAALQQLELGEISGPMDKIHGGLLNTPFVRPFQLPSDTLKEVLMGDEYFVFAVVRNPYTRIISCFLDKIAASAQQKRKILLTLGRDPEDIKQRISFRHFIDALMEQKVEEMDRHWQHQVVQLMPSEIKYDFICKMEDLSEGLKYIDQRIGGGLLDNMPPKPTNTRNTQGRVEQLLTPDIKADIAELYKKDFMVLGYDPQLLPS